MAEMKKILVGLAAVLLLAGCGSAPPKPKPVADNKPEDPVVLCTQQVMRAVAAGLNDVRNNAINGTTGFHEFIQIGLEMGHDSTYYQFASEILPPLIPVMSSQGQTAALSEGIAQAESRCRGYSISTQ